jgi:hypothetical protein
MLLMSRSHHRTPSDADSTSSKHNNSSSGAADATSQQKLLARNLQKPNDRNSRESRESRRSSPFFDRKSNFLTTSRVIRLFSAGVQVNAIGQFDL